MKKFIITILFFLTFIDGKSQTKNFIDQPYIEINGNADTLVTPNEIYIKIIISESDTKDKISVEDQETKMVNALKALGIDTERDLTTSDVASNFKYYFLRGKDVLKSKQYILKVSDAPTVSKVIMQLEDLGISNSSIDRVDHSELENIENFMRTKAVENAKARAIALAKPLNQTLGSAIYISDNLNVNIEDNRRVKLSEVVVTSFITPNMKDEEPPRIEFEKIQITSTVNVKFILK